MALLMVYVDIKGHTANGDFDDEAFRHPDICAKPSISRIATSDGERTVPFVDGTVFANVDELILGTGYSWPLPTRDYQNDPTLLFVGAVAAGLMFKISEWQAALAACILSGRATLPPWEEQRNWEEQRVARRGNGVPFTLVFPDFEEYFEGIRQPVDPVNGDEPGRDLPVFDQDWFEKTMAGHERRKKWRREENEEARRGPQAARPRL